jgi:hypothetical protein
MQEHTVHFITRLLSPPVPPEYSGSDSHLIGYARMLNVTIVGITHVDCVQIFSLHGLVLSSMLCLAKKFFFFFFFFTPTMCNGTNK